MFNIWYEEQLLPRDKQQVVWYYQLMEQKKTKTEQIGVSIVANFALEYVDTWRHDI